ncbi:hypothetical protein FRB91_002439, partial [Serendipita sp. 411]
MDYSSNHTNWPRYPTPMGFGVILEPHSAIEPTTYGTSLPVALVPDPGWVRRIERGSSPSEGSISPTSSTLSIPATPPLPIAHLGGYRVPLRSSSQPKGGTYTTTISSNMNEQLALIARCLDTATLDKILIELDAGELPSIQLCSGLLWEFDGGYRCPFEGCSKWSERRDHGVHHLWFDHFDIRIACTEHCGE